MQTVYPFEVDYLTDRPLSVRFEFAQAGAIGIMKYRGTMARIVPSRRAMANAPDVIGVSFVELSPLFLSDSHGDIEYRTGVAALLRPEAGMKAQYCGVNGFAGIVIPAARLIELVPNAEDLVGSELSPSVPAVRYLRRYVDFLLGEDLTDEDGRLQAHAEATLADLAALAIGASRDAGEIARVRGLRAARLQGILAGIKANFAQPDFSAEVLAARIGISTSYVQRLLYETGRTFTERVTGLRLQKARAMLADRACDRMRVSEIAFACGFNEVSHFNHCFRRRFGMTPTQGRGGNGRNGPRD
jgi:AraC-like DNA-binding protein